MHNMCSSIRGILVISSNRVELSIVKVKITGQIKRFWGMGLIARSLVIEVTETASILTIIIDKKIAKTKSSFST